MPINIPTGATMPLARRRELLARAAAHDFLIGHAGLDHDHVGALGQVAGDAAHRLVAVRRVSSFERPRML